MRGPRAGIRVRVLLASRRMNRSGPKATPDVPAPNGGDAVATAIAFGDAGSVTPMMRQYQEIKAGNPDSLLFYRMGDFYELVFQDPAIANGAPGIVLTKAGQHSGP